jgi:hypothetical protein
MKTKLSRGEIQKLVETDSKKKGDNRIMGAYNTGSGTQLVKASDQVNPGGASDATVLPANFGSDTF